MQRFLSWIDGGKYTAHDEVFDVGIATRKALHRFRNGAEPLECGGTSERDNGNGSLMRILPLAFYLYAIPKEWLNQLARRDYIEKLCEDFYRSLS